MYDFKYFTMLKIILFCTGATLTLWRSYDCLQKHLNDNLGTKIRMVHSYETILPAITFCSIYHAAYDLGEVDIDMYIR